MPLFFYESGFLFSISKERKSIDYILGKMKRLLIPYMFFSSFSYIPKVLLSGFAMRPIEGGGSDFIYRIIFPWENPVIFYWFLPTLFIISIIFHFLVKACNRNLILLTIGTCSIIMLLNDHFF